MRRKELAFLINGYLPQLYRGDGMLCLFIVLPLGKLFLGILNKLLYYWYNLHGKFTNLIIFHNFLVNKKFLLIYLILFVFHQDLQVYDKTYIFLNQRVYNHSIQLIPIYI